MTREDQIPSPPDGWDVQPLKRVAGINRATLPDDTRDELEFPYIDISSVESNGRINLGDPITFENAPSRARRIVAPGDTIISTVRTYLKAIGRITEDQEGAIASTGFAVLTPKPTLDSDYLWRFVQSDKFVRLVQAHSIGIGYPSIAPSELGALPIFVPPLETQRAIACFLDRETARIDTLIDKKRRLLDLLEEKRTALITRAVTRGLDPDVTMKDSGVEWIGEIPEHWEVSNAKAMFELHRGFDLPESDRQEGDIPVVSSGGITGSHNTAKIQGPGVVTGRYGSVGSVYYVEGPYWPLNTALYVRRFRGNNPHYVFYLLKLLPTLQYAAKSAVPGVDRKDVHEERIPFPPLPEQIAIAEQLRSVETDLAVIRDRLNTAIGLLQEYRIALISAVVTGRIDVTEGLQESIGASAPSSTVTGIGYHSIALRGISIHTKEVSMAVKHIPTGEVHSGSKGGKTGCGFDTREKPSHWVNTSARITCGKNGCKN